MGATLPTLLLTRPRESADYFANAANWPGRVVISPILKVVLRDIAPPGPGCAVIVTSQHGVRALAAVTARRDWPIWCVGPGSLSAAQAAGFSDLRAGGGTANRLFTQLCAERPQQDLVHLCGAHVTADLVGRLNAAGLRARAVVCYDQLAQKLSDAARACLMAPGQVVMPVFSPRSAALLAQAWHGLPKPRAQIYAAAISDAAAAGLTGLPLSGLRIAETPDQPGMLSAVALLQATLEPNQNPR